MTTPIEPDLAATDAGSPLSWSQERMWFLYRIDESAASYNLTMTRACRGRLDVDALQWALDEVVSRHEILRTVFTERDGVPRQFVRPACHVELPVVALSEAEAMAFLRGSAARPFDLEAAPPIRAVLVELHPTHHILQITVHHIAADGWSLWILLHELIQSYRYFVEGNGAPPPPPSKQYRDFAAEQRSAAADRALDEHAAYWRKRFRSLPAPLELPADGQRSANPMSPGAKAPLHVDAALVASLEDLARREGATLFMVLLAGFKLLLAKYSGQDDIAVGTPVANRRDGMESLIGCFVNTIVLRTDVSGRPSVRELLARVRATCLGGYAHQDMPFERLVDELNPARALNRNPLFQTMFALQTTPLSRVRIPMPRGLQLESVPIDGGTAQVDLTVSVWRTRAGLHGSVEYSTELFGPSTVDRLMAHWRQVLAAMVRAPEQSIAELPLLDADERETVVRQWNATATEWDGPSTVPALIAAQTARTPDAVALVAPNGDAVTYAALANRAAAVAATLRARSVGPETRVGVCMERSVDLVAALLGIWNAGAVYVPVDPGDPPARIAGLLREAGVAVVLADAVGEAVLPPDLPTILMTAAARSNGTEARPSTDAVVGGSQAAYVIYTSGSTGRPKGVVNTHAGLRNRLVWMQATYAIGPGDRVLHKTPVSFDVSLWELAVPISGATMVIAAPDGQRDNRYLTATIRREAVTVVHFVPAMLGSFLDEPDVSRCGTLRLGVSSGEALGAVAVARWCTRLPRAALANLYGPTEASIDVTAHLCGPADTQGRVPIGRPIANTQLYVLDDAQQPVPVGVAGALYIGGIGVARGYLGQPGLTAARFGPDPFDGAGGRLYRTGDRARWRADGALEYLGRLDTQIKLAGQRIEPGEIEAVLCETPGVREAAVVVREDAPGERRLVAYAVPAAGAAVDAAALRAAATERLPRAWVPAAFVVLPALPLTANGKLDRRSLPAPTMVAVPRADGAPRTPVEAQLCAIWAAVLRVPGVRREDNFFELGGDSISCLQVIAQARQHGLEFTLAQMIQHQTVAALAQHVTAARPLANGEAPAGGEAVPLTPIQRWFFEQRLVEPSHWNQAIVLRTRASVELRTIQRIVDGLVAHHDALRLRFREIGGSWVQRYAGSEDAACVVEEVELPADPAGYARFDAEAARLQASLDIERGPLVRAASFRFDDGEARVLLIVHHLVVDAMSWRILVDDLRSLWRQTIAGEPLSLPPRSSTLGQWSRWLSQRAATAAIASQLPYWERLARIDVPPLRRDRAGGENIVATEATVRVALPADETASLLRAIDRARVDHAILTALALAIGDWNGSRRVLVDIEGHGREASTDLDLSRTVGWFTSLYPQVIELDRSSPDPLRAVSEQLRGVPGDGLGYGMLRYLQRGGGRLARAREPELLFNYLGRLDTVQDGGDWSPATGRVGPVRGIRNRRSHVWEIVAFLERERLCLIWIHSEAIHDRATIVDLAEAALGRLRDIAAAQLRAADRPTPADFPLARITQEELDRLIVSRQKRAAPAHY